EVFESEYIKVPLGVYQCQLMVGEERGEEAHPLEPFEIHSYTFEVNVEVKDGKFVLQPVVSHHTNLLIVPYVCTYVTLCVDSNDLI
uniref:hypothetical protein n=1 Tax=Acinetobacter baumannii TaxID=470 RepID=UPI001C06F206